MLRVLDVTDIIDSPRRDVVSLYLDVDPTKPEHQHDPPAYLIWARHALGNLMETVPRDHREEAKKAVARILRFLRSRPRGRGVAVYAAPNLWRVYALPVPLPNRTRYGRPDVVPLLWAIDEYEPYAILVVDREQARIIVTYLGRSAVVDKEELWLNRRSWRFASGRPPTFTRRAGIGIGRGAQREKYEARIEEHVRRFWGKVAEGVDIFLRSTEIRRLIIGGPEEATTTVQALLPEASRERFVATVPLPARASLVEIQERTLPVALAEEHRRKASLVQAVLERAAAGSEGVVGRSATLAALQAGVVHTLVADRDLEGEAWQCLQCGYASAGTVSLCTVCGGPVETMTLPQVLPLLVRRSKTRLELVAPMEGRRLPEGMGAILRFRPVQMEEEREREEVPSPAGPRGD